MATKTGRDIHNSSIENRRSSIVIPRVPHFEICQPLEDSAVHYLFQAIEAAGLIIKKSCRFGIVSYEQGRWPQASSLIGKETA
jgi:hypothetical protein